MICEEGELADQLSPDQVHQQGGDAGQEGGVGDEVEQ